MTDETVAIWREIRALNPKAPLIALAGDSIVRGFGSGGFDFDPASPASFLQHPDRILDRFAKANGGKAAAAFSGILSISQLSKFVEKCLSPGDHFIFQDWGWRPATKDAVFHLFASIASLMQEFEGVNMWLMNGYADPGVDAEFDPNAHCRNAALSPNDIIEEVASAYGARVIDVNSRFSQVSTLLQPHGASLMLKDRIHPNAAGNVLLAGEIHARLFGSVPSMQIIEGTLAETLAQEGYPASLIPVLPSIFEKAIADGLQRN